MDQFQIENFCVLALAVRRLFHKLAHGIATLHGDSDVSVGMRAVLESVIEGGPRTVPQMARARPVTRQHIQGLVNALIEGGYVEYLDNPGHRRSNFVSPTEKGRRTFAAMRRREDAAFAHLELGATPQELAAASRVLKQLIAGFESRQWREIVDRYAPERAA